MDQTKELVKTIVEGLQEKRGKNIVTVDLSQTSGAICQYMYKNRAIIHADPLSALCTVNRQRLLICILACEIPYGIG